MLKYSLKHFLTLILCLTIIFSLPVVASADIGPKPSVNIDINIQYQDLEGATYYGTLLSKEESTGPSSAWDGVEGSERYYDYDYEIWQAFQQYVDKDGYLFDAAIGMTNYDDIKAIVDSML